MYPVIDDDFETESYRLYGTGHYNTTSAMKWYWQQYAPHGTGDPRVVPTRAQSLAGLPPAVIVTAELDPPCTSGDTYAQMLEAAGVLVRHHRFDGLFHGFLTFKSLSFTEPARRDIWAMLRGVLDEIGAIARWRMLERHFRVRVDCSVGRGRCSQSELGPWLRPARYGCSDSSVLLLPGN